MKKVLQIFNTFHQGGSERQAVQLVRLLREDGNFEVYIACLSDEGILRQELTKIGFTEIPEFKLTSFFNANFLRQARSCARFIRENEIKVVHAHDFYTNVFGMTAAMLARVPVKIASKRETGGMRSKGQKFIENQFFKMADGIVANSRAVKKYLIDEGLSSKKIEVIYNGVDLARLAPETNLSRPEILKMLNLPEGKKIVTLVANLRHPVKNQPMFLRAAQIVRNEVPNAAFVLAGEGERTELLKSMAEELGISADCHFIGRCSQIAELLSVSEIGVLSSFNEGFSNSILEYMAAGLPVVATRVGGAAETIIENETGFLVESGDDKTMSMRLIELLQDETKAKRYGEAGRKIVEERFSCEAQLQNTLNLYEKFLMR